MQPLMHLSANLAWRGYAPWLDQPVPCNGLSADQKPNVWHQLMYALVKRPAAGFRVLFGQLHKPTWEHGYEAANLHRPSPATLELNGAYEPTRGSKMLCMSAIDFLLQALLAANFSDESTVAVFTRPWRETRPNQPLLGDRENFSPRRTSGWLGFSRAFSPALKCF
jgi:hypothetical protein